ncbi:MAG: elongation factor 1-beta [Thermoplasmata archaeon]
MGKVAITFRLMPEGLETDIDKLQEDVKALLGDFVKSMQSKPFAFGLNALYVVALVPDEKGIADKLESSLGEIKEVQGVEVVGLDLL